MTAAIVPKFSDGSPAGGTTAMTIGTEYTLAETSGTNDLGSNGLFVVRLDLTALLSGEIVEVRGYSKVRTSDPVNQEFCGTLGGGLPLGGNRNKASTPLLVTAYGKFTVKQTAGTGRALPWVVMQL